MTWAGWALFSACFAGMTAVLAKIGIQGIPSNLAMAIRTTVVLVAAWGLVLIRGEAKDLTAIPSRTLLFLVLSGFATGASWLCYFKALELGPVSKVAPIDKLSFVIATALALIFLRGEKLTWPLGLGCVLIVAGVLLTLKG
ncbi:EamA family transporter [Armatimonas sp.]|uniref:EamA family transporter n=1 Tax=Armatimonas sp. TaxID=1872638 RepID=UPI00286ABFEA|nr:EamA family transporter [Armatimonas sp.]